MEEGNCCEDGKANVWSMFAGPCRDNGTQSGLLSLRIFPPQHLVHQYLVIALFWKQALYLVRGSYEEDQSFFLNLLGHDCFQLKNNLMPEMFWGAQSCFSGVLI